MGNENSTYAEETADITTELSRLVAAGWNEQQIARFARMRATYSRTTDNLLPKPVSLSSAEETRLTFYRWLRESGRLAG